MYHKGQCNMEKKPIFVLNVSDLCSSYMLWWFPIGAEVGYCTACTPAHSGHEYIINCFVNLLLNDLYSFERLTLQAYLVWGAWLLVYTFQIILKSQSPQIAALCFCLCNVCMPSNGQVSVGELGEPALLLGLLWNPKQLMSLSLFFSSNLLSYLGTCNLYRQGQLLCSGHGMIKL